MAASGARRRTCARRAATGEWIAPLCAADLAAPGPGPGRGAGARRTFPVGLLWAAVREIRRQVDIKFPKTRALDWGAFEFIGAASAKQWWGPD